jgi:hypothetical protein
LEVNKMTGIEYSARNRTRTLGDAAVDGLFAGLAAGVLMGIFLLLTGLIQGRATDEVLEVLVIGREMTPTSTILIHLAISGIYGAFFGMGLYLLRQGQVLSNSRWLIPLIGLGYGLLLALIARIILLPDSGSYMESLSWLLLVGAHGLYGLSLGAFTSLGLRRQG